ncbi:MAG: DUF1329 domain-containing protein [Candidatus Binatia bacterium]
MRSPLLAEAIAMFAVAVGCAAAAVDGDVPWTKSVPTIEEITSGKIKTGDQITAANLDAVRALLPESWIRNIEDGAVLTINPTTPTKNLLPPPQIQATLDNNGKASVGPDGTVTTKDGSAWVGGFPILQPQTALEVMANRTYFIPDEVIDEYDNYWVNPAGETYKTIVGQVSQFYIDGRVCLEPKPVVPGFPGELMRSLIHDLDPYDVRGLSVLSVLYVDQSKYPDAWGYIPVLRRVQRFSSAQRYDSVDGSDLRSGDLGGFSDPLGLWDFTLIDRKPMLVNLTSTNPIPEKGKDIPLIKGKYPRDAKAELRDTWIIDAKPKDPAHIYSRKKLYVDAGTYLSVGDFFDRQDNLWLGWHTHFIREDSHCGNHARSTLFRLYNYQTNSGSFYNLYRWDFNKPNVLSIQDFTLKRITSRGR